MASFTDAYDDFGTSTVKKRDRLFDSNSLLSEEQPRLQNSNLSGDFRIQLDFSDSNRIFPDEDSNKAPVIFSLTGGEARESLLI